MRPVDGYEATQAIRDWEKHSGRAPIPIVAVTAEGRIGDRELCFQAGMNDFLTKPIDLNDLKRILRSNLLAAPREFKAAVLEKLAKHQSTNGNLADELTDEYRCRTSQSSTPNSACL